MGSVNLAKMVNSVFARVDENYASDNAVTGKTRPEIVRVVEALNAGYREVFNKLYGSLRPQVLDSITLSPGVVSYDVSPVTNILQTMYVYPIYSPEKLLKQSNALDLTQAYGILTAQGDPEYWYRYNGKLSFYPVPAVSQYMVVEGSIKFVELTNAADTTFLPEEHDFLLQTYANAMEKAFWRDPDAGYWLQKFNDDLETLHAEGIRNMPTKLYAVDPYPDEIELQLRRNYT